jgi:hypothetical protein
MKYCHCGEPLHYTDKELERQLTELSAQLGDYARIINKDDRKTYLVQRHYIALHGIKGKDIASLGFKEADKEAKL